MPSQKRPSKKIRFLLAFVLVAVLACGAFLAWGWINLQKARSDVEGLKSVVSDPDFAKCEAVSEEARFYCKENVRSVLATRAEDPAKCAAIETPELRSACEKNIFIRLALKNRDLKACEKVPSEDGKSVCSDLVKVELAKTSAWGEFAKSGSGKEAPERPKLDCTAYSQKVAIDRCRAYKNSLDFEYEAILARVKLAKESVAAAMSGSQAPIETPSGTGKTAP